MAISWIETPCAAPSWVGGSPVVLLPVDGMPPPTPDVSAPVVVGPSPVVVGFPVAAPPSSPSLLDMSLSIVKSPAPVSALHPPAATTVASTDSAHHEANERLSIMSASHCDVRIAGAIVAVRTPVRYRAIRGAGPGNGHDRERLPRLNWNFSPVVRVLCCGRVLHLTSDDHMARAIVAHDHEVTVVVDALGDATTAVDHDVASAEHVALRERISDRREPARLERRDRALDRDDELRRDHAPIDRDASEQAQ